MGLFNLQSRYLWLFVLLFTIGATRQFDLTLIARVPLAEILAFGSLPFVLRGVPLARFGSRLWPIIGIFLLWMLGIVISDLVNGFSGGRFLRAFAKPVWSMLWLLFFIGVLHKDFRALLFYPAGTIIAAVQNYLAPQGFMEGYLESGGYQSVAFGVVPIVSAISLTLAVWSYRKSRLMAAFFFLCTASAMLAVGAPRNSAAIMLLNAFLVLFIWWTRRGGERKAFRLSFGRLVTFGLLSVLALTAIFYSYTYAAGQGWLGIEQYNKYVAQSNTVFGASPLGLLLAGRPQVFAAILAIMDAPIIGHGSWTGWLMNDYFYEAASLVATDARLLDQIISTGGGGAGHSVLFQAWLENGILAAVALLSFVWMMLRELILVVQKDSRLAPLLIFLGTSFLWAFFFSPFGVGTRVAIGLFLAFRVMKFHEIEVQTNIR